MGFKYPPERTDVHQLIARKDAIQAELDAQLSILQANRCTMNTPLVDREGFPRGDIDIYAVRHARVRIIELRNDMSSVMDQIGKALETIYDPAHTSQQQNSDTAPGEEIEELVPFGRVDGVAPYSPAAEAGMKREDVILKFGHLTKAAFTSNSLQPLAELVGANENRTISLKIVRDGETRHLSLIPKKWNGRGLLGCHIVPHSA